MEPNTWLQNHLSDADFDLLQGFVENTLDAGDGYDRLRFHALIHKIHNQFHDSKVAISKRDIPQYKRSETNV